MSKEAMKLALEALVKALPDMPVHTDWHLEAIKALREALAEQQEPVAWMYPDDYQRMTTSETFCTVFSVECGSPTHGKTTVPLYTSPPAQRTWVCLTDDDKCVKELYESDTNPEWIDGYTAGLKDAENKLRRYNAQPALVVEQLNPVAEVKLKQQGGNAGFATVINEIYDPMREPLRVGDKLYTSPPAQRKPLTDEQIAEMMMQTWGCASIAPRHAPAFARAIEAKLKDKSI